MMIKRAGSLLSLRNYQLIIKLFKLSFQCSSKNLLRNRHQKFSCHSFHSRWMTSLTDSFLVKSYWSISSCWFNRIHLRMKINSGFILCIHMSLKGMNQSRSSSKMIIISSNLLMKEWKKTQNKLPKMLWNTKYKEKNN